jgi:dephospho-CoA kinase
VFGKPDEMKKLTDVVWPLTRSRLEEMKAAAGDAVLILEAAVLVEAGWTDLVDEVWVVQVPVEVARARLMARNGIGEEQANARIESQLSNAERAAYARVLIDNSGTLEELESKVEEAWASLQARLKAAAS